MDNYIDNILAQLREGQKIEEIASALTQSINEANKQYEAELAAKREEEQKRALQAKVRENKTACAESAIAAINTLLSCYDVDTSGTISGEQLVEILDELVPTIQEYEKLMGKLNGLHSSAPRPAPTSALEDFLNKYVRN